MSDQPPLVPPSPPAAADPAFEPYSAPAYGQIGSEAPYGLQPSPGQPAPYQVAPQYVVNPSAPAHPLAITSLALGIIGIVGILGAFFVGVTVVAGICSPFAIWLGARSKREIRQDPQSYSGEGLATAGLVTGIVGLVLGVLALLAILAIVAFIAVIFASAGSGA
jgi:small-conductance mechanosensitive channel